MGSSKDALKRKDRSAGAHGASRGDGPTAPKSRIGGRRRWAIGVSALCATLVYLANTTHLAEPIGDGPVLIAHRSVSQGFDRQGLTGKTCTAARMLQRQHSLLENTIASMEAAFALGAGAVELDVHPTTDNRFAVFHDWTVDCRTEGEGVTREHTLAELQALDVGYGYTADGGRTFPFRGRGVGLMPSLDQVLSTFPDRDLIINVKSNDRREGVLLAALLAALPEDRAGEILVYGGPRPIAAIRERLPELVTITRPRLKRCLLRYIALGWSGHVPSACERGLITVPANVAPWLWGWPNRLLRRMDAAGSRVVLIGDYRGGGLSQGFDDPASFRELPADYSGGVWTDRIDLLGPASRQGVGVE